MSLQRQRFPLSYNVFRFTECLLPEFKSAATHLTDLDAVYCMRLHVLYNGFLYQAIMSIIHVLPVSGSVVYLSLTDHLHHSHPVIWVKYLWLYLTGATLFNL